MSASSDIEWTDATWNPTRGCRKISPGCKPRRRGRVGKGHHLADVRGYAYEHRLVAEEKLGRRLRDGEQVHHIDGDKANNDPRNLDVVTFAEHRVEHRHSGSVLRMPGEANPAVACACGCGQTFERYDRFGRPRRFLSGHNTAARNSRGRAA